MSDIEAPSNPLLQQAVGRWRDILALSGVPVDTFRKPNIPCPLCGGKDRFTFYDQGTGHYFCRGCGAGSGFTLLRKFLGKDVRGTMEAVERVIGKARVREEQPRDNPDDLREKIRRQWDAGERLGPNVRRYLERRGIDPDRAREIRQSPKGNMMTLIRDKDGRGCQLQVTFLDAEGRKTTEGRRYMRGTFPGGAAARVMPRSGSTLGIAEGVETALSASILRSVPCWAAMDEGHLRKWEPPPDVERVVIFGDNDPNYVGQSAAYDLAKRLKFEASKVNRLLRVDVDIPTLVKDWNDVLLARRPPAG